MLETIIGSLILMFVSSLGFIAYKHPDYFTKKLYIYIFVAATIIFYGIEIWNTALLVARINLIRIIQKDKIDTVMSLINDLMINPIILLISFISLLVYIHILLLVATGLKDRN